VADPSSRELTTIQESAAEIACHREAVDNLVDAGWILIPPDDYPGLCRRCKMIVEPGTRHEMFNGNQMFACSIVPVDANHVHNYEVVEGWYGFGQCACGEWNFD